jgi:hypothetical protein
MPRAPRGKRFVGSDGAVNVAAKNTNGDGSVYYEGPITGPNGKQRAGRWRATYRDERGRQPPKRHRLAGSSAARPNARRARRGPSRLVRLSRARETDRGIRWRVRARSRPVPKSR